MYSFPTPFDRDQVGRECQVANRMNVTRKPGDKRANEILAHRVLSVQDSRGQMDYNVIRVIRENPVFIRTLLNKLIGAVYHGRHQSPPSATFYRL